MLITSLRNTIPGRVWHGADFELPPCPPKTLRRGRVAAPSQGCTWPRSERSAQGDRHRADRDAHARETLDSTSRVPPTTRSVHRPAPSRRSPDAPTSTPVIGFRMSCVTPRNRSNSSADARQPEDRREGGPGRDAPTSSCSVSDGARGVSREETASEWRKASEFSLALRSPFSTLAHCREAAMATPHEREGRQAIALWVCASPRRSPVSEPISSTITLSSALPVPAAYLRPSSTASR